MIARHGPQTWLNWKFPSLIVWSVFPFLFLLQVGIYVLGLTPLAQDASHHQDYNIFSKGFPSEGNGGEQSARNALCKALPLLLGGGTTPQMSISTSGCFVATDFLHRHFKDFVCSNPPYRPCQVQLPNAILSLRAFKGPETRPAEMYGPPSNAAPAPTKGNDSEWW